jgi:drug/metabolite transporter (DMT)-like permease
MNPRAAVPGPAAAMLPMLALMLNAFIWGTSWWPFRALEARGLHPLWATAIIYGVAATAIAAARPRAIGQVLRTPSLWVLVAASGTTNAAFNWAVVVGDVVRVILLFYLMPVWALLLARALLGESLTRASALRVLVALAGAAIVLAPHDRALGWPMPRAPADWLGVIGGFSFALNNVMLRREARRPQEGRALAMFGGGVVMAAVLATASAAKGAIAGPPPAAPSWIAGALLLAVVFLVGNLALQYGAARLPAGVTAVVMLSEVVFASVSAVAFGAGALSPGLVAGGALIVLAAGLAALGRR